MTPIFFYLRNKNWGWLCRRDYSCQKPYLILIPNKIPLKRTEWKKCRSTNKKISILTIFTATISKVSTWVAETVQKVQKRTQISPSTTCKAKFNRNSIWEETDWAKTNPERSLRRIHFLSCAPACISHLQSDPWPKSTPTEERASARARERERGGEVQKWDGGEMEGKGVRMRNRTKLRGYCE